MTMNVQSSLKRTIRTIPIALAAAAVLAISSYSFSTPQASVDALSHDFGTLRKQAVAKHTFTLRNEGTSTLIVEKIEAG